MSGDDALLDQTDALMRRHRVFVAGAPAEAAGAHLAAESDDSSDDGSDDLPLLTEVVGTSQPVAADQEAAADARLERKLAEYRAAMALELESWLDEQLPQLVIRTMDGITDHVVALITNRAREELLPRLDAILVPSGVQVPAVDSGVQVPATSSGSSALSTETPGRVQAPTVDPGVPHPAEDSDRPA